MASTRIRLGQAIYKANGNHGGDQTHVADIYAARLARAERQILGCIGDVITGVHRSFVVGASREGLESCGIRILMTEEQFAVVAERVKRELISGIGGDVSANYVKSLVDGRGYAEFRYLDEDPWPARREIVSSRLLSIEHRLESFSSKPEDKIVKRSLRGTLIHMWRVLADRELSKAEMRKAERQQREVNDEGQVRYFYREPSGFRIVFANLNDTMGHKAILFDLQGRRTTEIVNSMIFGRYAIKYDPHGGRSGKKDNNQELYRYLRVN